MTTLTAPVTKAQLDLVRDRIERETRTWGQRKGYYAGNVDAVLREVFGSPKPEPTDADLAAVRAYVADVAILYCRDQGWCSEVEAGLTNVFGTQENGWRDGEGYTCEGFNDPDEDDDFDEIDADLAAPSITLTQALADAIASLTAVTESLRAMNAGRQG